MKMQAPFNVRSNVQTGFTLIELIVVIVILGILAATALPKFADLGGDARVATTKAARGALEATSAMAHGKYLVMGTSPSTIVMDNLTVNLTDGYPTADSVLATAAGLGSTTDWIMQVGAGGGTSTPTTVAGDIVFVPASLTGNVKGLTCYVKYSQATATTATPPVVTPPTISTVTTGC